MHHPTDRIAHSTAFVTPVVEHWLEGEIAQWLHYEGSIRRPIAPWANYLTTELHIAPLDYRKRRLLVFYRWSWGRIRLVFRSNHPSWIKELVTVGRYCKCTYLFLIGVIGFVWWWLARCWQHDSRSIWIWLLDSLICANKVSSQGFMWLNLGE